MSLLLLFLHLLCSHKPFGVLVQGQFYHVGEFGRERDVIPHLLEE